MQHPMLPRAWGEQPHKSNPPHESILTLLSKIISARFMPVRASFGIKRPAFTWGHGGDASPHIRRLFTNVRSLYARKGITWDATSYVAGGVGRAAPQNKHTHFYARKAQFGIKRPAFTWGYGGDASPHIQPHTLQTCAGFYFREGIVWA